MRYDPFKKKKKKTENVLKKRYGPIRTQNN